MAWRGKGAKGVGTGGAKRHRFILRNNIEGISRSSIRKLARRAGVVRMSALAYHESRAVLSVFVRHLVRDAVVYSEHANRKTVTKMDVLYALKRQGRTLYGFE
jgi:histone H4